MYLKHIMAAALAGVEHGRIGWSRRLGQDAGLSARKRRRRTSTRARTTGGNDFDASSRTVYSRLVEFKHGGTELEPGLAESWEISDDGLNYTFHLRPGVKFQTTDYFTPTRDLNADDVSSPSSASSTRTTRGSATLPAEPHLGILTPAWTCRNLAKGSRRSTT